MLKSANVTPIGARSAWVWRLRPSPSRATYRVQTENGWTHARASTEAARRGCGAHGPAEMRRLDHLSVSPDKGPCRRAGRFARQSPIPYTGYELIFKDGRANIMPNVTSKCLMKAIYRHPCQSIGVKVPSILAPRFFCINAPFDYGLLRTKLLKLEMKFDP